jgi:hypothetical protein
VKVITSGEESFPRVAAREEQSTVSVLVPTFNGAEVIGACLDGLAAQTLERHRFEVVVVHNGPDDGTVEAVDAFRARHPEVNLRLMELREAGAGRARNVGLSVARGEYVTFVDDDDRVTPAYLEAMLEEAEPNVVVVAMVADVTSHEPGAARDLDTYVARALRPVAGRTVAPLQLTTPFSYNAGKLVLTAAARLIRYDTSLRSGEDHVYWLGLFGDFRFRFRVLGSDTDATYLRLVRATGVGRQGDGYDFQVTQRLECLRALEAVDRSEATVDRVARVLSRGQAELVNAYLREHPDHGPRVAADAASMGVRRVPWTWVNEGLAHDLAVCYCFPPDLDTSGLVAAKRIRERGVVTDVVSQDLSRLRTVDADSIQLAGEFLGRTRVVGGWATFSGWGHVPPFVEAAWSALEEWEAEQGPYRSVYSRAMAVASHYAAALIRSRRPGIRWVAEFSDPLQINAMGEERVGDVVDDWLSDELRAAMRGAGFEPDDELRVFSWSERLVYALADEIVFTNPHQRDLMLGYCEDPALVERARSVARVQSHPVLPERYYEMSPVELGCPRDAVQLAYFGVFYETRDLGDIVSALVRLSQDERERVCLHVFTSEPDQLALQIARAGLAGTVRVSPYVPVLEFLHLTTTFDVLVVNDARTAGHHSLNPYLPSKVADYVGSGTPVWAIAEEGSVLSSLDVAHRSRLGDVDEAVRVLRRLIDARSARPISDNQSRTGLESP